MAPSELIELRTLRGEWIWQLLSTGGRFGLEGVDCVKHELTGIDAAILSVSEFLSSRFVRIELIPPKASELCSGLEVTDLEEHP